MTKALEGIKIIDFTHVQAGPACTQLLAWFGADVIKVERPGSGDVTRNQLRDIPDADALYFTMLAHGADGGILASSHIQTERFREVGHRFAGNDIDGARAAWSPLASLVPLLFAEANPMPIKHLLWRQGLIASPECRLPLTRISDALARRLDAFFAEREAA